MERLLARWERACASSAILRVVDIVLRGAGQVMFQNNPLSGALFLAALGWGSLAAGAPHVAIGGVSALVAASLAAQALRADKALLARGVYGYNGILTGLALSYFLGPGILVWIYAIFGGIVTAIAMLGPVNAVKPWSVPAHTYPFVLTTWILLLATSGTPEVAPPSSESLDALGSDALEQFVRGVLHSISQVFFKGDALSALLLVAGLAVSSLAAAAFAVGGSILAVITAHLFGVESDLISSGLQGFSPVLTAIALGTVFYRPSIRVTVFAALGTVATVIVQSALNAALTPMALPPLSAPFDLVAWMFFISGKHLDPSRRVQ